MSKRRKVIALIINLLVVLLETIGLTMCFYKYGLESFRYYTIDSNIIAFIASFAYSIAMVIDLIYEQDKNHHIINVLKYLGATALFITAIVVLTILGPMSSYKAVLLEDAMIYVHVLCPILTIISYMFVEKQTLRGYKVAFFPLSYTFVYGIIILILNIKKEMVGPYPFFEVYNHNIFFCAGSCIAILVVTYLFSVFINILNKKNS